MKNKSFTEQESQKATSRNWTWALEGGSATSNSSELLQLTAKELAAVSGGPEVVVGDGPG